MRKIVLSFTVVLICSVFTVISAQITAPKFGKGIQIMAQDSSFSMKIGLRFQSLLTNEWDVANDELSSLENHESAFFIRRSRLKFDGYAFNPKLKYKLELALSNRDNGGGNSSNFSNAANIILDAWVEWNFYKTLSLRAGQMKVGGNRERVISSGNLQFVDRSRLNSRYTLDRDVALMLINKHKVGSGDFILKEVVTLASGEGKNITSGNIGGYAYGFKVEAYPFGSFQSKGDYVGSAIKRESTPKLAVALSYEINQDAGRERGQKGSFITGLDGNPIGKDLNTFFADFMFKYQGLSIMGEYASRQTTDKSPDVLFLDEDVDVIVGTYYTGTGVNLQVGQMLKNNWEIAGRWTSINPQEGVANDETQYTIGVSKYVVGHKLKVQTDLTYRSIDTSDDDLFYRIQMDLHF